MSMINAREIAAPSASLSASSMLGQLGGSDSKVETLCCWIDRGEVVTGSATELSDGSLLIAGTSRCVKMGRDVHPLSERKELSRLARSAWAF